MRVCVWHRVCGGGGTASVSVCDVVRHCASGGPSAGVSSRESLHV